MKIEETLDNTNATKEQLQEVLAELKARAKKYIADNADLDAKGMDLARAGASGKQIADIGAMRRGLAELQGNNATLVADVQGRISAIENREAFEVKQSKWCGIEKLLFKREKHLKDAFESLSAAAAHLHIAHELFHGAAGAVSELTGMSRRDLGVGSVAIPMEMNLLHSAIKQFATGVGIISPEIASIHTPRVVGPLADAFGPPMSELLLGQWEHRDQRDPATRLRDEVAALANGKDPVVAMLNS